MGPYLSVAQFLDLPNEIKLKALSELPPKEIQLARRTCKHIRDLIDEPANATLLVGSALCEENRRLQESIDDVLDYNHGKANFLNALSRFLRHRGIWPDLDRQGQVLRLFQQAWAAQHPGLKHLSSEDDQLSFEAIAFGWITQLPLQLHLQHHLPAERTPVLSIASVESFVNLAYPEGLEDFLLRLGFTEDLMEEWYDQVIIHGVLRGPVGPCDELERPAWTLTTLRYWASKEPGPADEYPTMTVQDNLCNLPKLSELFGVPVPKFGFTDQFAYCVRAEWAYKKVEDAVGGRVLSAVEKAAILKEMYFF